MKTKKYRIGMVILAVCLAGTFAVVVFAGLTDKQQSLTEIKALYVFVQGLTEDAEKVGLTKEIIQKDVEERLRQEGIRIVSEEEGLRLAGKVVLYVNVNAHKRTRTPAYVYHVDLGILQEVSLVRAPEIRTMSITWNKGRLGHCPSKVLVKSVQETVGFLMDRFGEDYRAANPPENVL